MIALAATSRGKNDRNLGKGEFFISEIAYLAAIFAAIIIIFKVAFYKEDILNIIKITSSFYWLYTLPGYAIMLNFTSVFDFKIRFILGNVVGIGTTAFISYLLGITGVNIIYHWMIVPEIVIIFSLLVKFLPFLKNNKR